MEIVSLFFRENRLVFNFIRRLDTIPAKDWQCKARHTSNIMQPSLKEMYQRKSGRRISCFELKQKYIQEYQWRHHESNTVHLAETKRITYAKRALYR